MTRLNPQEQSFKQLISQDKEYRIPKYQRNYSWTREHWNDLWDDIVELEEFDDKQHYMGPIVLKEKESSKEVEIIDGQQRFCSLTIIVLATISLLKDWSNANIDKDSNEDYIKELKEIYIGKEGRLTPKRKLFLNKYDDPFYVTKLIEMYEEEPNSRDLLPSHILLKECFKYFKKQLNDKFQSKNGEEMVKFIHDTVMSNLSFIVIYVTSSDNAYTIFETLNARGLELSNTDLLKNYLFSLVKDDATDLNYIESRWDAIIDIIGFKFLPNFMRYYWVSHKKHVTDAKLFKDIKNNSSLRTSEQIKIFFNQLEEAAKIYDALSDVDNIIWRDKPECCEYIEELKILDNKAFKILAMSVYEKMPTEICKLLQLCSVISFRYFISEKNPNEIEKTYSDIAIKVSNGEITRFSRIKELLKELYIKDDVFEHNFAKCTIKSKNNKTKIKHLLIKIESYIEEKDIANSSKLSIEHILPENSSSPVWNEAFDNNTKDYIYRLGNYSIITNTDNRKCAAKDFEAKKNIYKDSRYKLSKDLCACPVWNIAELQKRQEYLARLAKEIWKVEY